MRKTDLGKNPGRESLLTRRAALMAAAGRSDAEISAALGVTKGALDVWKHSPLWQHLVSTYSSEIEERGIQNVADELSKDAPSNLSFIKRVRDGSFEDSKDRMILRMQAAKMLLDKQVPNADSRAQNETAARIILDGKLLGQVLHALRDVGTIDVTPEAIDEMQGAAKIPKMVAAKTPEELAAMELEEDEDEDEDED